MRRRLLIMLVVALALTACGSDSEAPAGLDWTATDIPVGADAGLAWADTRTGDVHLPDGSTLTGDRPISSFVLAGPGAYVVDAADDALVEVTADGARATGAHVDGGAVASPDGRYLAFLDPLAAPPNEADANLMTSVVVDLASGEEILRSTRGMGDPEEDDLTVLYESADFGVLGLTDETAWIKPAAGDVLEIDLGSGDVTPLPDVVVPDEGNPWVQPTVPPSPGGDWNADRSWGIKKVAVHDSSVDPDPASRQSRDVLVRGDGSELVPRPGTVNWSFDRWLDATTVVGFANANLEDPDSPGVMLPYSLLTCTVPDGECTVVPDTDGAILPEPSLY